jgi:AcrR family transcriptional regulator
MEVSSKAREERALSSDRARRIVEAMRESVAEVGVAGSTFERVAARAEVSRGLLHYYFGTKERLLVEVIRRDTEIRIEALGSELEATQSVDEFIMAFFSAFGRTMSEEQGYVYMVSELFIAGRHSEELASELGSLYGRGREVFTDILERKASDGVIAPRFGADAVLAYLFAAGDGAAVQALTDPSYDALGGAEVSYGVARYLLTSD